MSEVLILGAGIVGVTTALALQAKGFDVVLIDRSGSGSEASYGNAGIIQAEAAEPYALPRDLPTLFSYGLGTEQRCGMASLSISQNAKSFIVLFSLLIT